ncbi:hypothetical protein J132_10303 [Termitomyces sp. J132]|nr:hypothetical protein H2248_003488 [Termitomyces sp. 'cryptogamus']KNZ76496.1 hypothetical protein J132_10303 [Termitomyces sp. J132]
MIVLLKISWLIASPTLKYRHEIDARLHRYQVPNDPGVYHGVGKEKDPQQTRQTQRLDKAINPLELILRTLRHYRIIAEYWPFTLKEFGVTRELAVVLRDASIAHSKAATSAKFLHPDISNRNIMFKRNAAGTVEGYLIDWDLSLDLTLAYDQSTEVQPERMGTWQFLSIRSVQMNETGKPLTQDRIDDVESVYHLMLWMALRYTAHELKSTALTYMLGENFDPIDKDPHVRRSNMESGVLNGEARFSNHGIRTVLRRMRFVLCQRYIDPQSVFEDDKEFEAQRKAAEVEKTEALKALDDCNWLPNLLNAALDDDKIDWECNKGHVNHVLV